ncbi:hypothetical protein BDB00DRAFT_868456 [Zychaea mexicana]|uniref:uncharacterized protein n=1 Tax=Zychaea mexicana TaxID=64656 RepID=UPI0022FDF8EE|nr:uncharacterized protein BDB00DRAFT_868456 [Zychaea mexicana]KAI9497418.1 hypothetical protein BDB00DRAFT_868456 [Zychaea mexicana]
MNIISLQEIAQHNRRDDIWIILHGKVYDLTKFLPNHPGGQDIIMKYAGKDGTAAFEPIHSLDIVEQFLPSDVCVGEAEVSAAADNEARLLETEEDKRVRLARENMPRIEEMYNAFDFQSVAKLVLKENAYSYFSSGSSDDMTLRENHNAYHRIWFRPRVMVDVSKIDMTTTLLGAKVSMPLYISATSFCKLAHPDGEKEIVNARVHSDPPQWLQLYINTDRKATRKMIQQAESKGIQGLFITVDRAVVGPRGKSSNDKALLKQNRDEMSSVVHRERGSDLGTFVDPSMNWSDIAWFRSFTKMPIILKGIQRSEDAVLAYKYGCRGIVLSNHGGRQLDFSPSPIEILPEVMDALKREGCDTKNKFDVYVDGGIRRGSDVFKALALGARACGIGRPALYALSCYGDKGVERILELFQNELQMCMRLMGVSTLAEITADMVDTRNLKNHYVANPTDYLAMQTYEKMQPRGNIMSSKL